MPEATIGVKALFDMGDKGQLVAQLESFEWDFSPCEVRLTDGERALAARQVGSGNHEGNAIVILKPHGPWATVAADIERFRAHVGRVVLVRTTN
jgi:hypothetical protein